MADKPLISVFEYPRDRHVLDEQLKAVGETDLAAEKTVRDIIQKVRQHGYGAVCDFTKKFDGASISARSVKISSARMKNAWNNLSNELRIALRTAADRIEEFHKRQAPTGWTFSDEIGARLTQRVWPMQSVGIYVPGGRAAYPSTFLMNAIPARVAGVKKIVAITPPIQGRSGNKVILAAAHMMGVDALYQVGGAQGVAALAYGAAPIPRVDKVVGPGNIYVQTAKRLLYGIIDIDMVAGPTEVLVVADDSAPAEYVVADLLSQAEHEEGTSAWAILIGKRNLPALQNEIRRQTKTSPRGAIIEKSLRKNGAIVCVENEKQAAELANQRAPEHISILTRRPAALAKQIHSAGAVFLGKWTPESVGDYTAGPNHVLPTGRTARFFSPLSVADFVRTDHVVQMSRNALGKLADATITMAEAEGLHAHADAIRVRMKGNKAT